MAEQGKPEKNGMQVAGDMANEAIQMGKAAGKLASGNVVGAVADAAKSKVGRFILAIPIVFFGLIFLLYVHCPACYLRGLKQLLII